MDKPGPLAPVSKPFDLVPAEGIRSSMVTTAFTLPGLRVTKNLGVVRGIVVLSRSVIGNFGAGLQMLFGGHVTIYTSMCERARQEAFQILLEHASQVGANAVVGMRYDATEIMGGVTEVIAYGTAVTVEPDGAAYR